MTRLPCLGQPCFGQRLTGQAAPQPWLIVLTTLLIAALFNPLRQWLQMLIDRRFYRSKYDAARTIETIGATLRSELDLAGLSAQLVEVVWATMQPTQITLWLSTTQAASSVHAEAAPVSGGDPRR